MLNEILFHHVGYVVADIRLSAAQFAQLGYVAGEILYDEGLQVELCYLTKEGAPLVELYISCSLVRLKPICFMPMVLCRIIWLTKLWDLIKLVRSCLPKAMNGCLPRYR